MSFGAKGFVLFCVVAVSIMGLFGCSGKYLLVAGQTEMTEADYQKAREECIQLTNGASYSNRFKYVPGVAPKDAPRTNVATRYASCMESKGFVCLNCRRTFYAQPKSGAEYK